MSDIDQYALPADTGKKNKPSSRLVKVGKRVRPYIDSLLAANSLVGDRPVFDEVNFPFTRLLEENADVIAAEARQIIAERNGIHAIREISPDHKRIATDRRWKSLFLIGYGYRFDHNCNRCPETTRLVEQIPELNSAFFSIMEAGAEIPRHRGVTKAFLTCHLGVVVPEDRLNCGIEVHDQTCNWEAGRAIVFDDTFEHEAWNRTEQDRVILLLQFKRPMNLIGRLLGNLFLTGVRFSSFVQDGRKNLVAKDRALGLNASSRRLS